MSKEFTLNHLYRILGLYCLATLLLAVSFQAGAQRGPEIDKNSIAIAGYGPNAEPRALPIYITDFNVIHDAPCIAKLHWRTNTELGMSDFFVEHSTDGITFDVLYSFPSNGEAE